MKRTRNQASVLFTLCWVRSFLCGEILRREPLGCQCCSVFRWDCVFELWREAWQTGWERTVHGDWRGPWLSPRSLCLRGARPYWFQAELGKARSNDLFLQWENGPCGSGRSACQASYSSERLLSMPDLSWAGLSHIPNARRPGSPEVHTGENSLALRGSGQPVGLSDGCIIGDSNGVLFSAYKLTISTEGQMTMTDSHTATLSVLV